MTAPTITRSPRTDRKARVHRVPQCTTRTQCVPRNPLPLPQDPQEARGDSHSGHCDDRFTHDPVRDDPRESVAVWLAYFSIYLGTILVITGLATRAMAAMLLPWE